MNSLKNILVLLTGLAIAVSCEKEVDNIKKLDSAPPPSNITATFDITQDNSGLVTILPTAEGVTKYLVLFGDVEYETPAEYGVNETITHIYGEGLFTVVITAVGVSGLTSAYVQEINVTFRAPEDLVVTIEQDIVNPFMVSVSATALYAAVMDIYFGDVANEAPVHAMPDSTVTHLYEEPGDYVITVVAKSGGAATTSATGNVSVSGATGPVNLPVNFESYTVNYAFTDFGSVTSSVTDNPDISGINTSARVAQSLKPSGAEIWAGSYLTLENPIGFSVNNIFKVKVWSPKANAVVKLKVENLNDPDIWYEVDELTTITGAWEELSYDFSGISLVEEYQKLVIFFDFGNPGDGSVYYFDDIKLVPGNLPPVFPVEDFEGVPPDFISFGNIAAIEVVSNPNPAGVNTTAKTAQLIKTSGAETWAGAFFEVDTPLDLDNYSRIKIKTWSPNAGIIVKLKLENEDVSITHEVDITTSVANAWEEMVYDFSEAPAADYIRIVFFFDFGNPGDGSIYYFDEIELTN
ncbi:MAG: PKD domain-containing protein [Bacteroidales bacterium]|nr:PKD domain-containing protein [Bacteroidales bacterium]